MTLRSLATETGVRVWLTPGEKGTSVVDNSNLWLKRAEEIFQKRGMGQGASSEAVQFATSMLAALYGPKSPQLAQFQAGFEAIAKTAPHPDHIENPAWELAFGAIKNAKAEIEAGLIISLRVAVAGEILVELIRLAKEIWLTEQKRRRTQVRS